jgi:uncharacterized protein (TIGR02117 family)
LTLHGSSEWIGIGWGSHAFYTSAARYSDMRLGRVWRAICGDDAVMRLETYGAIPTDPHPSVFRVPVNEPQLARLLNQISAQIGSQALPIAGFSDTDVFFPAQGRFNLFQTCNVWVSQQLNHAGIEMGVWTPTPYAVRLSLWWFGRQPI